MEVEKIVFATKNEEKIKEINDILGKKYKVITMKEAGIDIEIEENGLTFEENALIKAKAVSQFTDLTVLADDSGLEVDYLNKEPGVHSARFAGIDTPYNVKNNLIIDRLKSAKERERTARFVCVIAAVLPNKEFFTTKGEIEGTIAYKEKGTNGFGYDPIFYVPEYKMTTGEMPRELKNKISHRGKALEKMKEKLFLGINK